LKIVVLAAGFSSRLGKPKALVRIHGVSLLRRTLLLAAALRDASIVVVVPPACARYRREGGRLAVTWARNAQRSLGLSSSVKCGLRHSRYNAAALLLPVDLACLKLGELEGLVSRWRASPSRVFATRMASAMAQYAGIPLILPVRLFPRAQNLQGDVGLRALIAGMPAAERTLVDLPSAHGDVDTVRDLASARRRWN
jgi:molybdenum cofactor cytidylyltransferase